MGKRSLLSGVVACRWKAWKSSGGNKLQVADARRLGGSENSLRGSFLC